MYSNLTRAESQPPPFCHWFVASFEYIREVIVSLNKPSYYQIFRELIRAGCIPFRHAHNDSAHLLIRPCYVARAITQPSSYLHLFLIPACDNYKESKSFQLHHLFLFYNVERSIAHFNKRTALSRHDLGRFSHGLMLLLLGKIDHNHVSHLASFGLHANAIHTGPMTSNVQFRPYVRPDTNQRSSKTLRWLG